MLMFAMAKVEKDAFSQKHSTSNSYGVNQQMKQDNVVDDLLKGEITQEIKNLRWRTYKILQHSRGFKNQITVGSDVKVTKNTYSLKKVKLDNNDYPLEILFKNGVNTITFNETLNILNEGNKIDVENLNSKAKGESYLSVFRESPANFNLENYTSKLHIRKYNENEKLIEFYVSKYPESFNTKSNLFISKIKSLMEKPNSDNILDIKEIGFSSFQTLGCEDFNEFLYRIIKFDSIVEFNGNYIIKFIGEVIFENKYMLTEFIEKDLDNKYNNVEMKENNTLYFD